MTKNSVLLIFFNPITEIKDNTFKDVTFESIRMDCSKLTKIAKNAYNGTSGLIKVFGLSDCEFVPSLNWTNIFEVINKFPNLENLELYNVNITGTDLQKFKPVNPDKLSLVLIQDNISFKDIKSNTFKLSNSNLGAIHISNTALNYIADYAFVTGNNSKYLNIDLSNNQLLNGSSFANNSLANLGLTKLTIRGQNSITYLNEQAFRPFLEGEYRYLYIADLQLDCNDCRNYWIVVNQKSIENRVNVNGLRCHNGVNFLDQDNFKHC